MSLLKHIAGCLFGSAAFVCCKKDINSLGLQSQSASLTVVNSIAGSNPLVTNFSALQGDKSASDTFMWFSSAAEIPNSTYEEFSSYNGEQPLALSYITDTSVKVWSGTLNLPVASIHTLFLMGPDTLHVDTLLTTDTPPVYSDADSVVGVRFANLVIGSDPLLVDVQTNLGNALVNNLGYKGASSFFPLPLTESNPVSDQYVFEFRDMLSDSVLATYTYNSPVRYKNVTVALGGIWGGSMNAFVIFDY